MLLAEEREQLEEENRKFLRNMYEMAERECARKRSNGFPCSRENCQKFKTLKCMHPEKAGFPAKRY